MNIRHYFNRDLYNTVLANPDDLAPRLILCDDLGDHGIEELPEFVRISCELSAMPDEITAGSPESFRFTELIERQVRLLVNERFIPIVTQRHGFLGQAIHMKSVERLLFDGVIVSNQVYWDHVPVFDWVYARNRVWSCGKQIPLAANCDLDTVDIQPIEKRGDIGVRPREVCPIVLLPLRTVETSEGTKTQFVQYHFWRGFVYRAMMDMENFCEFASEIYGNHPIQEFSLRGRAPHQCTRDEVNNDNFEVGGTGEEPKLGLNDDPRFVYSWYGTGHLSQAFQIYEQSNVAIPSNPNAVISAMSDLQQQIEEYPNTPNTDQVDALAQNILAGIFSPVGAPEFVEAAYQARRPCYLLSYIFRRMHLIQLSRTKEDQVKAGLYGYNSTTLVFDTQRQAIKALNEALLSLASDWYQQRAYEGLRWKGKRCEGY